MKYELKQIPTKSEIEDNIRSVVSKGEIDLVTQVTSYFEGIGGFVETPYGKVELTRNGVKSSIAYGIGRNKAIAFSAVPDVLVRGKIIDYQNNWKQRGYDTIAVAAPIDIGEKGYYLAAIVKVENERNGYYLHEVALQEKEDTSAFKTGTAKSGTPSAEISSIYTLLNKLQDVKKKQLKVSEDAPKTQNGLPEGVIKYQLKNTDNLSDTELLAQYLERNGQVAQSVLRKVGDIKISEAKAKRLVSSRLREYGVVGSVAKESAEYIATVLEIASHPGIEGRDIVADITNEIKRVIESTPYEFNVNADDYAEVVQILKDYGNKRVYLTEDQDALRNVVLFLFHSPFYGT